MALKDFMPYGASELLADQDRRMARASASATALLVIVFAALMLALPRTRVIAAHTPEIEPTIRSCAQAVGAKPKSRNSNPLIQSQDFTEDNDKNVRGSFACGFIVQTSIKNGA